MLKKIEMTGSGSFTPPGRFITIRELFGLDEADVEAVEERIRTHMDAVFKNRPDGVPREEKPPAPELEV